LVSALFRLRSGFAVAVTAASIYLPLWLSHQSYWGNGLVNLSEPIIYYQTYEQIYTVALPMAILIALFGHAQALYRGVTSLTRRAPQTVSTDTISRREIRRRTAEIQAIPAVNEADTLAEDDALETIIRDTRKLQEEMGNATAAKVVDNGVT